MRIHLISGLPRAGSTLLAAILRQNPAFHAGMSSPLCEVLGNLTHTMSFGEYGIFSSDDQRKRMLSAVAEAYYQDETSAGRTIFDTNRAWCARLPMAAELFPSARVIVCLRSPAWILDSVESLVQRNPLRASKMFGPEGGGSVYARTESMVKGHFLGSSLNGLRQAWYSECANRMIAVRYESLADQPQFVISRLYEMLGEPAFKHNFDYVEFEEPEFDARLNLPGLHKVKGPVRLVRRQPILPPDIFTQHDRCFWDAPGHNPRGVPIL